MKYCTKCGAKVGETNKFCSNCGNPTNLYIEQTKKEIKNQKEEKKEKLLLTIGTLLLIIASIIFAFANWNEMSSIFKVLFLAIEALLFLSLSLFCKKVNYKMSYKALWFIGITLIPVILNLVAADKMLGEYLSYDGNGIYVYLSISSIICFILYFISYKFLKSNIFMFISNLFIYLTVIFILYAFNLDSIKKISLIFPILCLYNLLIGVLTNHIKNEKDRKNINAFVSLTIFISSIYSISYISESSMDYFIISLVAISNIISLMYMLYKSNYRFYSYLYTIMLYIVSDVAICFIFRNYFSVSMLFIVLVSILINFIINVKSNNYLKNTSFILMLINIFSILTINNIIGYITLFICYTLLLITFLFIIKLKVNEFQRVISIFLLPSIILNITNNFIKIFTLMDLSIILLISSIILFTIYVILYEKNKDKYTKTIFELFAYIQLILSSIAILESNVSILAFILNEILWIYYFIFSSVAKKHISLNITLLVLLIINFILCSIKYSISIFYSLLFITIITSILDFIKTKFKNKKSPYIYIGIVTCALAAEFEFSKIAIIGICINVISYALTYYLLNKNHNPSFVVKFIYTIIGFGLIYDLYEYFISNLVISNLLILITYIVIIISMFLLQVDSDRKVLSYSILTTIPYFVLVENVDFMSKYSTTFSVVIWIIMIFIYFEYVFKLKEKDKILFEIVLLSLIHLFTLSDIFIINFILSAFYIFYGFYKKREQFTLFGTILLILNLVYNIFKIAENVTVTYVLLVIGVIMLAYVFYIEAKKNNKK